MPVPGLSLVGFMDQQQAIAYLQNHCIPPNADPQAILADWNAARANLGPPTPNAGFPSIADIPVEHQPHLAALQNMPWQAGLFHAGSPWQLKLIAIDELLAFQFQVDTSWSERHCAGLTNPVSLAGALPICLPVNPEPPSATICQNAHSVMIRSRSLNLRLTEQGILPNPNGPATIGIRIAGSLPHVQVVRYNGRCYLSNGFHRTVGLRRLGLTAVPCLFRDFNDPTEFGIDPAGNTFGVALLESQNPPTCGHFGNNRAHAVTLRTVSRMIQISWAEHIMPDE
jgi:hypothetical protein